MRKFFKYRGKRVRLMQVHAIRNWGLVISLPFLILLLVYHYFVTYPAFLRITNFKNGWIYVFPALVTLLLSGLAVSVAFFLIRWSRLNDGFFMRRFKMQMLARFMLSNNFVNQLTRKGKNGDKMKLSLPKTYYLHKSDVDIFTFETGNKFHAQVIMLGKTLSEMFLADLVNITWEMGFISYEFLMDNAQKRISFEEVTAVDGKIVLMKGIVWEYDKLPHMLIVGGTGGGKTYFIYCLIKALVAEGRVHLADPKMADLAEFSHFKAFKNLVVSDKEDIFVQFQEAMDLMDKRYLYMKSLKNYTIGKNYRYYDMKPEFFVLDEEAALVSVLKGTEYEKFFEMITPIILKARQAGVFLIFATQRPDVSTLPGAIRDNFMCRVALGRNSPQGYDMTFPDSKDKAFVNKKIVGRGYIDIGTGIPIEFYSPLVPKDFDFVEYFQNLPEMTFTDVSKIELTPKAKKELDDVYDWLKESEDEILSRNQSEALSNFMEEKEEKILELEAKVNIPSYRDKLKKSA